MSSEHGRRTADGSGASGSSGDKGPASGAEFHDLRFVVISGPSGSGKTTIVERLLTQSPVKLVKSVSATTRSPRPHEVPGVDYHFLTPAEFQARRERGEFLEAAQVRSSGHWYGTLKSEVRHARELGGWSLLEIDVQGAREVMRQCPQALSFFVRTPSEADLERRLRSRGTESDDVIRMRLETAQRELAEATCYHHQVVNHSLEDAVREMVGHLVQWERSSND